MSIPMQNDELRKIAAVARSQAHYMSLKGTYLESLESLKSLKDSNKPARVKRFKVINSYRAEIDSDDWQSAPLLLSYQIMNWAMKKINKNNNAKRGISSNKPDYLPKLLEKKGLNESQIGEEALRSQVEHAMILENTLRKFPPLKDISMTVYRGENCNSFYYQKAAAMKLGDNLTILPFLSTSINRHVAQRFTYNMNACLWEITIPDKQIFPYVSEKVPERLGNEESAKHSEQEVLLPTHAILKLQQKLTEQTPKVYKFTLEGFAKKSPDFWENTLTNLLDVLPKNDNDPDNDTPPSKIRKSGGVRTTQKKMKNNRKSCRKARK